MTTKTMVSTEAPEDTYVQIAVYEATRLRWNALKANISHREKRQLTNDELLNTLITMAEGVNHLRTNGTS